MTRLHIIIPLLALFVLAACSDLGVNSASEEVAGKANNPNAVANTETAVYEVTITNRTSGQPFSPPIMATHRTSTQFWSVGHPASLGIQMIAENGNNGPLRAALMEDKHVFDMAEGGAPLIPESNPGEAPFDFEATYTISSALGAKYLSAAWMLICTNDGFSGLESVRLPKKVGDSVELETAAYDAGTEINTEYFGDLVPPCQGLIGITGDPGTGMSNPDLAEGGTIGMHAGIAGGTDLVPEVHGWEGPVAGVSIVRVQ